MALAVRVGQIVRHRPENRGSGATREKLPELRKISAERGSQATMSPFNLSLRTTIYLLASAASFAVGLFIPAYYDWTGADQSRPSPVVAQTAVGFLLAAAIAWLSLPWLPITRSPPREDRADRLRFSVRSLLVVTSAIAVGTALLLKFPSATGGIFSAAAYCYAMWFGISHKHHRLPTAALVACITLPYIWAVSHRPFLRGLPVIVRMVLSVPSLLPTALIAAVAERNLHDLEWLAMLLTGSELFLGVWAIRTSPRCGIAFLVLVWILSTFGSFGLHALARM